MLHISAISQGHESVELFSCRSFFPNKITHSYPSFYGYQYSETMGCHQKSPTDYYGDINYDDFPNGSDIMGVHMASKSSKKVTFEFVLKLLSFSGDI